MQRVADASGSKYSSGADPTPATRAPPPVIANKPVFTPTRTGGLGPNPATAAPKPAMSQGAGLDDDGWGPDAPPVTRTQLEKVQSAYQPTKVNLQQLKEENATPASRSGATAAALPEDRGDVVRGGYQPVGKVDITAIRRQAADPSQLKDERPEPVKGAYEPVGKVDIAAIRARAQKPGGADDGDTRAPPHTAIRNETTLPERPATASTAERLTALPKPKVSNNLGSGQTFSGTKPPLPDTLGPKPTSMSAQVGSASRTFADQGGKTPAQLWAERKARERGGASSAGVESHPIQSQTSGPGGWKSSYTGKTWAPVQTTHTAKSMSAEVEAHEQQEAEVPHQPSVHDVRDQFAPSHTVPIPGLPAGPTEPEAEHDAQQVVPTPPQQPRSPTPPTPPVRDSSPIRVAMPVGRGVADAHDEQRSQHPAMPVQSLQETVPDEKDLEESDIGRAAAAAGGIRAQAQYDYEKAEDNEIELCEGELVTEIEMIDKDWWVGVNVRGERGLFPGNYVEVLEESTVQVPGLEAEPEPEPEPGSIPMVPPSSTGATATALYDYEAAEDNEISFPEGGKIVDVVSAS